MAKNPLAAKVKAIQDILRKDAGIDGDAQRISQISVVFALKALDEMITNRSIPESALPVELRWKSLSSTGIFSESEEKIRVLRDYISGLSEIESHSIGLLKSLSGVNVYFTSDSVFAATVGKIDELFKSSSHKKVGEMYEKILGDLQNAGNSGEFYTPRGITEFIAQSISMREGDSVLDPACGTGGLLLSASEVYESKTLNASFFGIEKKNLPYLLLSTNIVVHDQQGSFHTVNGNALSRRTHTLLGKDRFSVILSNPPFGGIEEDETTRDNVTNSISKDTSELFVNLIMGLLDTNGRAAIILPDGFLSAGGSKEKTRQTILEEFNLHTVVRIPSGAFSPYTGIATNILYFNKERPNEKIWYVEHKCPDKIKKYSKTNPVHISDFAQILDWWEARESTEFSWQVDRKELIKNRCNMDIRNPYVRDIDLPEYTKVISSLEEAIYEYSTGLEDLAGIIALSGYSDPDRILQEINAIANQKNGHDALKSVFLKMAMQGKLSNQMRMTSQTENMVLDDLLLLNSSISILENNTHIITPTEWIHTNMESIGYVVSGGTPKSDNEEYWGDSSAIPWLTPTDLYGIKSKYISSGERFISPAGMKDSSAKMVDAGTVLFSSRAPVGYIAIASSPLTTNQGFKSIIPLHQHMSDYIYYYLLAAKDSIELRATGTTFKEVSTRQMRSTPISIPRTWDELNYIVGLLDKIFNKIRIIQGKKEEMIKLERDLYAEGIHRFTSV